MPWPGGAADFRVRGPVQRIRLVRDRLCFESDARREKGWRWGEQVVRDEVDGQTREQFILGQQQQFFFEHEFDAFHFEERVGQLVATCSSSCIDNSSHSLFSDACCALRLFSSFESLWVSSVLM